MLIILRYLATGDLLLPVADCIDIAKSSACRAVGEVVQLLAYMAPDNIKFPQPEEAHQLAQKFYNIANIPGVMKCADGTHTLIQSPDGEDVEMYICQKGFYSSNVQGIYDSELKFLHTVASWPGSIHDARIFDNSHVCHMLEQGNYRGLYLLGDSWYPCREYLLTAIMNPRNERHYNVSHAQTRNCVERAFWCIAKVCILRYTHLY